jgi:hypothetical protein
MLLFKQEAGISCKAFSVLFRVDHNSVTRLCNLVLLMLCSFLEYPGRSKHACAC